MSSPRNYLVWGANGVSGIAALRALVEQPSEVVGSILAVSRRPPQVDLKDKRIKFVSIDILNASVEEITDQLKANGGDKVNAALHYTYIEKKDAQELLANAKQRLDELHAEVSSPRHYYGITTMLRLYSFQKLFAPTNLLEHRNINGFSTILSLTIHS